MDGDGPCGFRQHLGAAPRNLRPDPLLLQVSQPPSARMSSAAVSLFTGFLTTLKKNETSLQGEGQAPSEAVRTEGQLWPPSHAGDPLGAP